MPELGTKSTTPLPNGISISLDRVCVPTRCSGLESVCVQLYLDDTSNGDDGEGNTVFLHMPMAEGTPAEALNVRWGMVGALRDTPQALCRGRPGFHPMPDVAKVVVTANALGTTGATRHGVVGGSTIGLRDMLQAFCRDGVAHVPIVNSFFPEREVTPLLLAPACMGLRLTRLLDQDGSMQEIMRVSLHCSKESAARNLEAYESGVKAGLFKPSSLPAKPRYMAMRDLLGSAITRVWMDRISSGLYPLPENAPSNFQLLKDEERAKYLVEEPCKGMFRMGATMNAR